METRNDEQRLSSTLYHRTNSSDLAGMSLCPRVVTMAEDDDDELLQMVRHARVRHVPGARIPRNARARPVRAPRERAVFVVSFEIPVDGRSRPTNIALRLRQAPRPVEVVHRSLGVPRPFDARGAVGTRRFQVRVAP